MSKTYTASAEGKIVGTRTTKNRTYAFAIVAEFNLEVARAQAGDRATTNDYTYCLDILSDQRDRTYTSDARLAEIRADVAGGSFEAYREVVRARVLAHIESKVAEGYYELKTVAWCGRLDLAQKEVAKISKWRHPGYQNIQIVPAVEVTK